MKLLLVVLTAGACATASTGDLPGEDPDAGNNPPPPPPPDDAPPVDMPPPPPESVTLQQTADMMVGGGTPVCRDGFGTIFAMGAYRVFPLAEHQVTGTFHVENVTFAVRSSDGSPTLTVKLGTYTGALDGATLALDKISQLAQADVSPPDSGAALVDVPLTADVPAGNNVVVEIAADTSTIFDPLAVFGATSAAETHPSYLRFAQCNNGNNTPHSLADLGAPDTHLLITVTGKR